MSPDSFGVYVRRRLDHWGDVFCLARDCEYLGHQSRNILQVLIEHKGEMPERTQGFKPLEISEEAMQVERIVMDISRSDVAMACALRGYYCGSGRRKVERWEQANLLLASAGSRAVSARQFLALQELGFQRVRGYLEGLSVAA